MSLPQLDAWIKILFNYAPQMVMIAAAILLVRRHRQWFAVALLATAALNFILPISIILVQTSANQRLVEMQPQLKNVKTQQELQQLVSADPQIQSYGTMKNWLGQGNFFSNLIFAIVLFITIGALLPKPALAQPTTIESKTHDAP
jgi:hypothetical protein